MNKEIAKKWFYQACHDLEIAEKNIAIEGYDIAAFLTHQAIEKLLKAIFALRGMEIPKIHYLDELARGLALSENLIEELASLTIDYTLARYPDVSEQTPYKEYNEEIAREKVEIGRSIFKLLEKEYKPLLNEEEK